MIKKILIFLLFPLVALLAEKELLERSDIERVMKQIFDEHVDKKRVTKDVLQNAFSAYFEQFDPFGIYLLKSEVTPFTEMSARELEKVESAYRQGDYAIFEKMNDVVKKSIVRSRAIRSKLEADPSALLKLAQAMHSPDSRVKGVVFAGTETELRERIKNYLVGFLHEEIVRFGEKSVRGFEKQALALNEKELRQEEDRYTYLKPNGEPLSKEEKENLFTLHILKALTKSLDAHTAFFDQDEAYDMKVRLEKGFEGIGIAFQQSPQGIIVAHILEDSPAAKNGEVKPGDLLVEINGVKTTALDFEEVMQRLKGEKNEPVTLSFSRDASQKTFTVTLKRDLIVMKGDRVDVKKEEFGNGVIGYIKLHSFYQNDKGVTSEKDVRDAIKTLNHDGNLRGLILDLRENSGGFLSQAVKVAGLFITNGVIVISKYSSGDEKIYRDMDNRVYYSGPLVVLTSRATASAAEIVAQALQDYGVAVIVGDDHTYGKGTIQSQTVTDNKGSSFFKVTVGEYYTVSGKTPQLKGVRADIVVPGPYSNLEFGEEYLEHAISKQDKIDEAYRDSLKDIDPNLRPWYMKYYMPTLQTKSITWKPLITQLKKNSETRLSKNKNYQLFLKKLEVKGVPVKMDKKGDEDDLQGNFGADDFQLSEAQNIVKDMIYLESKKRQNEYMIGAEQERAP